MKKIVVAISLLICVATAYSQTLLKTLIAPGEPENIHGMMVGESIFLSMQINGTSHGQKNHSVLIHANGEHQKIDLGPMSGHPIVAGVKGVDSLCFYFLEYFQKAVVVATVLVDSNKSQKLPGRISVPGVIYGSYVVGSDLFMLCGVKGEFKLKLLQIRNGRLIAQNDFALTFNLGKRKNQRVTFIDMRNPTTPQQAIGDVKICFDGRAIWILVDEPMNERDVTITENSLFRTTTIRLDLDTKKIIVKAFYEQKSFFTSAVLGNDIYRFVYGFGQFRVDQFDFYSGKKKNSVPLVAGTDSIYARIGGKFKTEKHLRSRQPIIIDRVLGSLFIVDSLSNGERVFTIGDYGDTHTALSVFSPAAPIAGLIITASSLIIGELAEGPLSAVYCYVHGTLGKSMIMANDVPLLRKRVDDFDNRQMKNKVSYDYRGYINLPDKTFEITQEHHSDEIEIRTFELN